MAVKITKNTDCGVILNSGKLIKIVGEYTMLKECLKDKIFLYYKKRYIKNGKPTITFNEFLEMVEEI